MTLYKLLLDKRIEYLVSAIKNTRDNKLYNEFSGKADMCGELLDLLSEETLKVEVVTKEEAMKKKETVWTGEITW